MVTEINNNFPTSIYQIIIVAIINLLATINGVLSLDCCPSEIGQAHICALSASVSHDYNSCFGKLSAVLDLKHSEKDVTFYINVHRIT